MTGLEWLVINALSVLGFGLGVMIVENFVERRGPFYAFWEAYKAVICAVTRMCTTPKRRRIAASQARRQRHEQLVQELMPPRSPSEPWYSPEEREAFGINDTMRFIAETDRILNGLAWEETKAKMIPPSHSVIDGDRVEIHAVGRVEPVRVDKLNTYERAAREIPF